MDVMKRVWIIAGSVLLLAACGSDATPAAPPPATTVTATTVAPTTAATTTTTAETTTTSTSSTTSTTLLLFGAAKVRHDLEAAGFPVTDDQIQALQTMCDLMNAGTRGVKAWLTPSPGTPGTNVFTIVRAGVAAFCPRWLPDVDAAGVQVG